MLHRVSVGEYVTLEIMATCTSGPSIRHAADEKLGLWDYGERAPPGASTNRQPSRSMQAWKRSPNPALMLSSGVRALVGVAASVVAVVISI